MKRKRRHLTAEFKARVALEAIKGEKTNRDEYRSVEAREWYLASRLEHATVQASTSDAAFFSARTVACWPDFKQIGEVFESGDPESQTFLGCAAVCARAASCLPRILIATENIVLPSHWAGKHNWLVVIVIFQKFYY